MRIYTLKNKLSIAFTFMAVLFSFSSQAVEDELRRNLSIKVKYFQEQAGNRKYKCQFILENTGTEDVELSAIKVRVYHDIGVYDGVAMGESEGNKGNWVSAQSDQNGMYMHKWEFTDGMMISSNQKFTKTVVFNPILGETKNYKVLAGIYENEEIIEDEESCDNLSVNGYTYFNPKLFPDSLKAIANTHFKFKPVENDSLDRYNICNPYNFTNGLGLKIAKVTVYGTITNFGEATFEVAKSFLEIKAKQATNSLKINYKLEKIFPYDVANSELAIKAKEESEVSTVVLEIFPELKLTFREGDEVFEIEDEANVEISRCEEYAVFALNQNLEDLTYLWKVKEGKTGEVMEGEEDYKAKLRVGEYELSVTDWNQIEHTFSVKVTQDNSITYELSDNLEISVFKTNTTPLGLRITSEKQPKSVLWTSASGERIEGLNPTVNPSESQYYYLEMKDEQGCSYTDSTYVKVIQEDIVFNMLESYVFGSCEDLTKKNILAKVTGYKDLTYRWTNTEDDQLISESEMATLDVGSYSLSVSDALGYEKEHLFQIEKATAPSLKFKSDIVLKPNDELKTKIEVEYMAIELKEFEWNNLLYLHDEDILENTYVLPKDFGVYDYSLSITDKYNCTATDNLQVSFLDYLSPELGDDKAETRLNNSVEIAVLANDLVKEGGWDLSSFEIINAPDYGDVEVKKALETLLVYYTPNTNYHGNDQFSYSICTNLGKCAEASVSVEIKDQETSKMMVMSNPDKNRLMVKDVENYPNSSIMVFDKRGSIVYQASPYSNDFYGKPNVSGMILGSAGQLPEGTYYYIVDYGTTEKEMLKGFVYITK